MEQLFNIDFKRINSLNDKESAERKKNFEYFLKGGLPNKKNENWKFSDLNYIISKNFKNITNNDEFKFDEKIESIHDFDHNKVIIVNGSLKSYDLHFEEKEKVKIETLKSLEGFHHQSKNNLDYLSFNSLPLGTAPEIYSLECLKKISNLAEDKESTEYLTNYITDNQDLFNTSDFVVSKNHNFDWRGLVNLKLT